MALAPAAELTSVAPLLVSSTASMASESCGATALVVMATSTSAWGATSRPSATMDRFRKSA